MMSPQEAIGFMSSYNLFVSRPCHGLKLLLSSSYIFSRYVGGRRIGSWKGGESPVHLVGALHFRGRGGGAGGCGARGPGTYTAIFYLPILYQHAENKHKVFLCLFFVCLVLSLSLLQVNVGRDSSEDSTKTCLMAAVQVF